MKTLPRPITLIATAVVALFSVVGCSSEHQDTVDEEEHSSFGYQVAGDLRTTNAGSLEGSSAHVQALSGKLYPGVYVPGPSGQMIPNTDLVTTQVIPGSEQRVKYTLSEQAVFSDGTPVTCADYLLAFTAGRNPEVFGSHMPLFDDTSELTCTPGSKEFTVIFKEGRGARWRGLFEAGTVLPAHAVAQRLGVTVEQLAEQLNSDDPTRMRSIGDAWRFGFDLGNFDSDLQVSFGPYKVESVGEQGEVRLVANEFYYGDAPTEPRLVVWPGSVDSETLAKDGLLMVGDLRENAPSWFDPDAEMNRLEVETVVGELTETLTFPETGDWSLTEYRQALLRCLDPNSVAAASSEVAGVDVPVAPVHVVQHDDPLAKRLSDVVGSRLGVDLEAASAIAGRQVRVGYPYPSARHAAMVESIRRSCEPAGVEIVDATAAGKTLADLARLEYDDVGELTSTEGTIDALLHVVDPMTEYPAAANQAEELGALRAQEGYLWDELPSIPLAAEPSTFAVDRSVANVVPYTGSSGIGWNLNRWQLKPSSETRQHSE